MSDLFPEDGAGDGLYGLQASHQCPAQDGAHPGGGEADRELQLRSGDQSPEQLQQLGEAESWQAAGPVLSLSSVVPQQRTKHK